ncbi:AraC-type DNA-binding protein [Amphibacillus marinus]|uniref:AraC-type DNA-binding protein n=1 Tax=Amphibacillus marinus TaxID=872970 RepID=A0A1H8LRN2_9BACI|nr:AraC family transcriptional regulator [Amphibacillus marinus]SEO07528.1 AraC-type DNA-binding protein [Amphibacillus marinus]
MKHSITEILNYLKSHVNEGISIAEIANHFGYSKYHFSRTFKKITGFSPKSYLAAIKIEQSIEQLLKEKRTVLRAHLQVGYLSSSTFSQSFKDSTGLSPKQYQLQVNQLHQFLQEEAENIDLRNTITYKGKLENTANQCHVYLKYPDSFNGGITFVGLFHHPIPDHSPIIGQAVLKKQHTSFINIPDGDFYLLACCIEKSHNPINYFVLKDALRGKVEKRLSFNAEHPVHSVELQLRPPLPEDPPIIINLPQLLKEALMK